MLGESMYSSYLRDYLIEQGFPEENIVENWGKYQGGIDMVILSHDKLTPIAVFDIKVGDSRASLNLKSIPQIVKVVEHYDIKVPTFVAFYNRVRKKFEFIDIPLVFDLNPAIEIDYKQFRKDENVLDTLPSYASLSNRQESVRQIEVQKKQKKYINGFNIVCWIGVPIAGIALLLLDVLAIMPLTTERLIVLGVVLISVMLPFFKEISFKDVTLKRQDKVDSTK